MLHVLLKLFSILCPTWKFEKINVQDGGIFLGNRFLCVRTKLRDRIRKFGLWALQSSPLRNFGVHKMAVCSSVLQVSSGHSGVASRRHTKRKDWCILAALRILQKWPLCGRLKHKATQICYAFSLLAGKGLHKLLL